MTITHPELVKALAKPGADIAVSLMPQAADLWHHATGVAGECGELLEALIHGPQELDRINLIEELGDLEFYMEGMRQNIRITRQEVFAEDYYDPSLVAYDPFQSAVLLTIVGAHLLDLAKKVAIYNKDVAREDFKRLMAAFETHLFCIRASLNITREETIAGNIAKLQVRYSSGSYSNQQAQVRADKVEESA